MTAPSPNPESPLSGLIALILLFGIPWLITLIKKKRQLGKTWRHSAVSDIVIKGKELKCGHCGYNRFSKVEGLLTTSWMTFFHMAYWNRSCACFICAKCNHMHWFHSVEESSVSQKIDD